MIENIRHVTEDHGTIHLVTTDETDVTFCNERRVNLRPAGHPADTPERAAKLGAWVNIRDEMCDECREQFNDYLFDPEVTA